MKKNRPRRFFFMRDEKKFLQGTASPTSRQRGSAALSLRGAKRRGNPFSFFGGDGFPRQ